MISSTYFLAPLDLIPIDCSAFGEFIYLAIDARLEAHHFSDCVHIASFSDSGSNVVLAKGLLTPGDAEPCFNHDLKHVVEDVLCWLGFLVTLLSVLQWILLLFP